MFQNRNFRNWIAVTKLTAQCDQPYRGAPGSSATHGFDTGVQGCPISRAVLAREMGLYPDPDEKAANTTRSPEVCLDRSRGAGKECSPRRKPWVPSRKTPQVPEGRKKILEEKNRPEVEGHDFGRAVMVSNNARL